MYRNICCVLGALWLTGLSAGGAEVQRSTFREVDTLFANPGAGWMSSQRSPKQEPRFPCSVVYIRFAWMDAEPEPGKYNWKFIDDAIAAWQPRHARVALRVMACSAHSAGYYTSPKWLFDAGCKGFDYEIKDNQPTSGGKKITRIEPDYADPLFLKHHGAFIKALGARYDGQPGVECLDIGSYGVWGEWHTPHPAPAAVRHQIVDMYLNAFRKTPLVFMTDDAEVLPYALAHGAGLRRDGVGSPWHEKNWIGSKKYAAVPGMAEAWTKAPVVFEWYGTYADMKSRGWSFDAAVNFMLTNHVTLINDNLGPVPPEAQPQLDRLARLAGYRFVLREIAHPARARRGTDLRVDMRWANVGVGKLYHPFQLRLSLLDASGRSACSSAGQADPRGWLPGEHAVTETLAIPATLPAGAYTLAVALVDPAGQRPPLRLAVDVPVQAGHYRTSTLQVE